MNWQKKALLTFVLFAASGLLLTDGCQKSGSNSPAVSRAVPESTIQIETKANALVVSTSAAVFTLHANGELKGALKKDGKLISLEATGKDSEQIVRIENAEHSGVILDFGTAEIREAQGKLGNVGKQIRVKGKIPGTELEEVSTLEIYDSFPNLALLSLQIRNSGAKPVSIDSITMQAHNFSSNADSESSPSPLWTFQGSSLKWGKDEIFALPAKFSQENPFGAPVSTKDDLGYAGGGIPVVAFWSKNVGEAIGHIETLPLVLALPVKSTDSDMVNASVRIPSNSELKTGDTISTPRTFLTVYSGDFYKPLSLWSDVIDKEGLKKPTNNEENYAVSWCGWGYEFGVTPKQMLDTIPKLRELGIHWATLDDGWFNNYGDWQPRSPAFAGDSIQGMVKTFHDQGIKVQLWWLPLAAEDGHFAYGGRKYEVSEVVKQHPDWLILDKQGKPARMARNLATLCPALPEVQSYYKQLTERFVREWGFDGHKLDNIYATPLCYNPKHHHKSPYDSVYAMGEVYKIIFETTRAIKPDSITQSCPCGTPPSLAWLRFMDQAVTADPVGSIQVRRRIKMYKALLGANAAVYGDHVELTRVNNVFTDKEQDVGKDFASTLGTGGVLGTKFTWPDYGPKFKNVYLDPEKDSYWKKWIGLYNEKMLSKGDFLDLYVYGFDKPEAYAIKKDGSIYYSFYAPPASKEGKAAGANVGQSWNGEVELRGLSAKPYQVTDFVNNKDLGTVTGPTGKLSVEFNDYLLLQVTPIK
jgi:alpha-galactosidase